MYIYAGTVYPYLYLLKCQGAHTLKKNVFRNPISCKIIKCLNEPPNSLGLGKEGTGITKSIEIKKREDNQGLGSTTTVEAIAVAATENWWHDAFSSSLMAFSSSIKKTTKTGKKKDKDKKEKKSKKKKESKESDSSDPTATTTSTSSITTTTATAAPSFDELFIATGGKRLGMRARADQKGKIRRTEGTTTAN